MAKLNLQEEPSASNITEEQIETALASYNAYLQGQGGLEQSQQEETTHKCDAGGTTHFSRRSKIYYPDHFEPSELKSQLYTASEEDVKQGVKDPKQDSKSTTPSPAAPSTSRPLYKLRFDDLDFAHQNNRIWSVNLQLYKRKADSATYNDYIRGMNPVETVKVFRVVKKYSDNGQWIKKHVLLAVKNVPSEDEGFVSFNITSGIKDWLQQQQQQYQSQMDLELAVLIDTPQSVDTGATFPSAIIFDIPSPTNKDAKNARLLVERLNEKERLDSILKRRRKRQQTNNIDNDHCFNNTNETNCCIKELTVDFHEDLGMDWIIFPHTFTPNYCKGQCVDPNWPTATNSTYYLIKLRQSNPTAAPEPCCVAHDLQPLTVLMALNGKVVVEAIPGMITNSCICR